MLIKSKEMDSFYGIVHDTACLLFIYKIATIIFRTMAFIPFIKMIILCGFMLVMWCHAEETNFMLKQNITEDIVNLKDKLHPYN